MKRASRCLMLCLALFGLPASAQNAPSAAPAEERGPGLFAFAGRTPCPFGAGEDEHACRRVALSDAATVARIDLEKHRIVIANAQSYDDKTLIADVFMPASAKAPDGKPVSLILHVKLYKSRKPGIRFSAHSHSPVRGPFEKIALEPWQIVAEDGLHHQQAVFTPAQGVEALTDPGLAANLIREFVEIKDNRLALGDAPDITVLLGTSKLAYPVLRARFDAPAAQTREQLDDILRHGTWAVHLVPLSNRIPRHVTQRELFLYGLENEPIVHKIRSGGMRKETPFILGAKAGKGYLAVGGETVDFPQAAHTALRYFDLSFIGLILAWHQIHP